MSDLQLYTAAEVAELLRMNLQVVQRKLQAGEIPGYRIGREWRIEREQLMVWLERHSNQRDHRLDRWFDEHGRLRALPARRSLRRDVLVRVAAGLSPQRTYREIELNEVLARVNDDVATMRREMIAEKLLVRTRAGVYKVAAAR